MKRTMILLTALVLILSLGLDAEAKKRKAKPKRAKKEAVTQPVEAPAPTEEPAAQATQAPETAAPLAPAADTSAPDTAAADTAVRQPLEPAASEASPPAVEVIEASQVGALEAPAAAEVGSTRLDAGTAPAEDSGGPVFPLTVGVEAGGSFAQLVSKLGSSANATLEVGYLLPQWDQRLEIFVDFAYVQPKRSGTVSDPRLAEGSYDFTITERELAVAIGPLARLFPPRTPLNFYGQLGLQVRMQGGRTVGDAASAAFGQNDETATRVGGMLAGGVELRVGPGAFAGELAFSFSDLSQRVTGDASTGGLAVLVGYHVLY